MLAIGLLLLCVDVVLGLKYLAYNPRYATSHYAFNQRLAELLVNAGHQVVSIEPIIYRNSTFAELHHPNFTAIVVDYDIKAAGAIANLLENVWNDEVPMNSLDIAGAMMYENCVKMLSDQQLMGRIHGSEFDLGITEWIDACGLGLFQRVGVRRWITAYGSYISPMHLAKLGVPPMSSFVPVEQDDNNGQRSLWTRLTDFLIYQYLDHVIFPGIISRTEQAYKVFDKNLRYWDLYAQSQYIWINTNEFFDFPQPLSDKVIRIGGLGMHNMESEKPMSPDIQQIYDRPGKGVILVSFGSIAKSKDMTRQMKDTLLRLFKETPDVQFLWKYEDEAEDIARGLPNVHTARWLPQRRILMHPRTLAFLTHGGMNSVTEAAFAGTPMLAVPLFGDQGRVVLMLRRKRVLMPLDRAALTQVDRLRAAVHEIVGQKSYKENAIRLAKGLRSQPITPEQRLLQSAEFAAQYDVHEHLDMPGRHMSTLAFYNLDVYALLALAAIALISCALAATLKAYRLVRQSVGKQKCD